MDDRPGAESLAGERARNATIRRGVAAGLLSRALGAAIPLLLVPICIQLFGTEVFGLWVATASLATALVFSDLGLGNGLLTRLSQAHAEGASARGRQITSSVYVVVLGLAAALSLVVGAIAAARWWHVILRVPASLNGVSSDLVIALCILSFVLGIPTGLVAKVLYALQRPGASNLLQAGSAALALPAVLLVRGLDGGVIPGLTAVLFTAPLVNAVATVWVFRSAVGRAYAPGLAHFSGAVGRHLVSLGLRFMGLSTAVAVALGLDNWLVGATLGLTASAAFALPLRIFAQVGQVVNILTMPLWPANAEALARGNLAWVRRTTRRMSLLAGGGVALLGAALVVVGPPVIDLWAGTNFDVSRVLIAGMTLWWVAHAAMAPYFMVQNASAVLTTQLLGWVAYCAVSVPAKYLTASWTETMVGIPWVGAACYLAVVVPACLVGYRRALAVGADPRAVTPATG